MTAPAPATPPVQPEPTIDEILQQIIENQKAMSEVLQSHEAQIKRLQFRLGRVEKP